MASQVRLAEVIGALSIATDLAMAQPLEAALASCILSVRLAEAAGLDEATVADCYWHALLRFVGCNADTYLIASLLGDEMALRSDFATIDPGRQREVGAMVVKAVRRSHAGDSPLQVAVAVVRGLVGGAAIQKSFLGHCEVGQRLGERLGFGAGVIAALGQLYARWDGKGVPATKGEAVPMPALVVGLAQDMVTFLRLDGTDAAVHIARDRRAKAYAPALADAFCAAAPQLCSGLEGEQVWETVLSYEPGPVRWLDDEGLDRAFAAMADFSDLKSPWFAGHASRVSTRAAEAARQVGLSAAEVTTVRRAGLVHDLGNAAVPNTIWGATTELRDDDRAAIHLHTYHVGRILRRPEALHEIASVAAMHHERLDGSGSHRGVDGRSQPMAARVLAAAEVHAGLTEDRPHRAAWSADGAAEHMRAEVVAGRLDGTAVEAVLGSGGPRTTGPRGREGFSALTEREVQVLRLIARGLATKQVARELGVSQKTADSHIQHIYAKARVSTRAGATLFAIESGLFEAST